ncbi:GH35 family beta-galactosidase [Silvibacterium acidisoli]|uniref:GH35 family beta-galactosidase n=1 Tax=Acidobacteriaceae bacterium ZG23-2 TaxID=2883246 RepID=UPI00406C99D5
MPSLPSLFSPSRRSTALLLGAALATSCSLLAQEAPQLKEQNGRHELLVDGKPFLMLGGQINNSSSWPETMKNVWPEMEGMHANTVEAPVYWEQMEPSPGKFDFSLVDMLLSQAREHHFHLVLLWFGTWKNGEMHYAPEWVKSDTAHYPRMIDERGEPIQVLSANSQANLDADRKAFTALAHHLREADGTQHTVVFIQVENESGAIGSVRDHSPAAQKQFAGQVPSEVVKAMHKSPGTWTEVFGPDADETFQAYSMAHYINEVAKAGKAEFPIPMYCNVWVQYSHGYVIRGRQMPGYDYPSGGPIQPMIDVWKAAAPSIDILAPDVYTADRGAQKELLATYARPDNPLLIPETGSGDAFAPGLFYALGLGAIGFSPFGTDQTSWTFKPGEVPKAHAESYELLEPIDQVIAKLNYEGKLKTAVEEAGKPEETLTFGRWQAKVGFGFPQRDGEQHAPGTEKNLGRALVAQLGPDEFLVTGIDARVTFYLADGEKGHAQILKAEEGVYDGETWTPSRIWNGDQTDRGLNFKHEHQVVRIRLGTY